jgi:DNA-binding transcriptional LysR family regulator
MSLAQLEYFVAVAEEEHLSRAAARLHISQPPLTRQVQRLEAELGVQLFERTARGMKLLPAGQRFLVRARQILGLIDATRREASSWTSPTPPPR